MDEGLSDEDLNQLIKRENNNYLPPIRHEWVIENYPKLVEYLDDQYLDDHQQHPVKGNPNNSICMSMNKELRGTNHAPLQKPDVMRSLDHGYGPFKIGETKWRLKLRTPSFEVWLKRAVENDDDGNGGGNPPNDESLKFRVWYGYLGLSCQCGRCFIYPGTIPMQNSENEVTFTAANNKFLLGKLPPEASEHTKICVAFVASVRPENFAMGAPCDFRVVVLDKNDAGKVLAEFDAHRAVLRKGSPVFKAMLGEDSRFEEAKTGVLKIGNFARETVKVLLAFIYEGQEMSDFGVQMNCSQPLLELLDAAEQYQVDEFLKEECGRRLLKQIKCGNAVELAIKADQYRLEELKQGAMRYIRENRCLILRFHNKQSLVDLLPYGLLVDYQNFVAQLGE